MESRRYRSDRKGVQPAPGITEMRRVVSGIGADGRSTVEHEDFTPYIKTSTEWIKYAEVWATPSKVPDGEGFTDAAADAQGLDPVDPHGTFFRVAAFEPDPPGVDISTLMHATTTVDYNIILSGEITCIYEDSSEVDLGPGDFLVQRGVPHAWSNRGQETCVFVTVMVGAPGHGAADGGWRPLE
jgi:mannose-6-phosphate isomerase-like protein (cupin superfamily)